MARLPEDSSQTSFTTRWSLLKLCEQNGDEHIVAWAAVLILTAAARIMRTTVKNQILRDSHIPRGIISRLFVRVIRSNECTKPNH